MADNITPEETPTTEPEQPAVPSTSPQPGSTNPSTVEPPTVKESVASWTKRKLISVMLGVAVLSILFGGSIGLSIGLNIFEKHSSMPGIEKQWHQPGDTSAGDNNPKHGRDFSEHGDSRGETLSGNPEDEAANSEEETR